MKRWRRAPLQHPLAPAFARAVESLCTALSPGTERQYNIAVRSFLVYLGAAPARAETHVFIIENHADYGVDRCLVSGARCGKVVASAYCQSRNFAQAVVEQP